jgi:hypothetical protein
MLTAKLQQLNLTTLRALLIVVGKFKMPSKDILEAVVDSVPVKAISRASLALVIPLSIWGISILYGLNNMVITLQSQMKERTADRYTATDAHKDLTALMTLISRNQSDIEVLFKNQQTDEKFMYENVLRR